ncbi:hypothetical protein GCM10022276_12160 [Sphingomonas limnosediminicola]|uniref:PEP-CTERM protein-sorting domain-containing protein n=1 Tax=Sphingomonas limnosediminicola TaxID=940133 RepID=A0ABP7L5A0_9SPHN
MTKYLLAASALSLCSTPVWAAESIVNGGFEAPVVNSTCCNTVPPDLLVGWTATPNVNVVVGTYASTNGNLAAEGNQYLDLVGQGGTGSISQTFGTLAGTVYNLSFVYSHNLFNPAVTSASASFSVDGLIGGISHSTGTNANLDWQSYFGSFTATGSSATLNFTNLTGGVNEGILLDAVSVQAVPEPATWAMMLFGFGAIGFQMRRRKSATLAQLA